MDNLAIAKTVAAAIVGSGTTTIVNAIIKNNVVTTDKLIPKVTVPVASAVIGMMAADQTRKYAGEKIDEAKDWYDKTFTNVN